MLKVFGAVLLLIGGLSLGLNAAGRLSQRVDSLRQFIRAINIIAAQTYYGDAFLTNVLDKAASDTNGAVSCFFAAMSRRLSANRFILPTEAARESLEELTGRLAFTAADCQAVLFMAEKLGSMQRAAQDDYLKLIENEFISRLSEAQQASQQKGKLYSYGGVCGSLLLIILMI